MPWFANASYLRCESKQFALDLVKLAGHEDPNIAVPSATEAEFFVLAQVGKELRKYTGCNGTKHGCERNLEPL